ncbi:MAG TPA: M23 family metallopeptidase [Candidatus Coprenecus stercoravium]|uniref:M23 family metallopeptidase n=1 Tax=Candidatus Coprenecus stercoravium TaxID=2840735 RepID=A0A9D2GPR0_9BACT|nr:M23 family metallopeptidase [Candidatus Coprenecus stercoravium]
MSEKNKPARKRPARKYLFAILDNDTHDYLYAIRGTKHAALSGIIGIAALLCVITFCITAFTPVKRVIPGYPTSSTQKQAVENAAMVDSLENRVRVMTLQLTNIRRIIAGEVPLPLDSLLSVGGVETAETAAEAMEHSADSILREKIDSIEKYNLRPSGSEPQIEGMLFFPPAKGVVTESYNPGKGHPFVDIAVQNNSAVCAVLDGTVIAAYWNDDTGYNIHVQHSNDLVSIYKHNTKLLKKVGDKVSAGTTISLAGNAGDLSTGPHLHFELWHQGEPIDPSLYINF